MDGEYLSDKARQLFGIAPTCQYWCTVARSWLIIISKATTFAGSPFSRDAALLVPKVIAAGEKEGPVSLFSSTASHFGIVPHDLYDGSVGLKLSY